MSASFAASKRASTGSACVRTALISRSSVRSSTTSASSPAITSSDWRSNVSSCRARASSFGPFDPVDGATCQLLTTTTSAPPTRACRRAKRRARRDDREPSTPTTTRPRGGGGLSRSGTTTTGQGAWEEARTPTEPSMIARTPLRPRDPTTRRSSPWASLSRTAGASSGARTVVASTSGLARRTYSALSVSNSCPASRSSSTATRPEAP